MLCSEGPVTKANTLPENTICAVVVDSAASDTRVFCSANFPRHPLGSIMVIEREQVCIVVSHGVVLPFWIHYIALPEFLKSIAPTKVTLVASGHDRNRRRMGAIVSPETPQCWHRWREHYSPKNWRVT